MKTLTALAAAVSIAVLAGAAGAAGGPLFNASGGLQGILAPTGYRYVTIDERNVVLLVRIAPDQHVAAERPLPGRYTIPAVAMDRTTAGLSVDGRTLVLVQPRFRWGRKHTKFLLVSLPGMHIRAAVTLRGGFTFDAMSPDTSASTSSGTSRRTTRPATRCGRSTRPAHVSSPARSSTGASPTKKCAATRSPA